MRVFIAFILCIISAFAQPWNSPTQKFKPQGATSALTIQDLFIKGIGTDVRWYGAKQGVDSFDSTAAFHAAIAALPASGGTIYAPGRYACNITITKDNVRIVGSSMSDTSSNTEVLIPYNNANPVVTIGDDTKYLYGVRLDNISLFGGNAGSGLYGLRIRGGVQNAHFTKLSVRNFGATGIYAKGGDNYNCEWIFFDGLICRTPTVGNPTGMLLEYGSTWLTAIYVNNYKIEGPPVGTGYALTLDSVPLGLSHGWLQATDLHGVLFKKTWAPYPLISGVASTIEAVGGSKCGVEVYSNNRRKTDFFSGDIYISGGNVIKLANGTVTTMVSGWALGSAELYSPHIVANAYFNDGTDPTQSNLKIYGSGNALYAANDAATSYWSLTSGGNFNINNAKLRLETIGKGLEVKTGTNGRAGTATLVGGTVTVANTSITANTLVLMTVKTRGGTTGTLGYTLNAGTSFVITSSSGTDTSTVGWFLVELIP